MWKEKFHNFIHSGEHWIHVAYCSALFIEGHGLYAAIGGILGLFVFISILIGGE